MTSKQQHHCHCESWAGKICTCHLGIAFLSCIDCSRLELTAYTDTEQGSDYCAICNSAKKIEAELEAERNKPSRWRRFFGISPSPKPNPLNLVPPRSGSSVTRPRETTQPYIDLSIPCSDYIVKKDVYSDDNEPQRLC